MITQDDAELIIRERAREVGRKLRTTRADDITELCYRFGVPEDRVSEVEEIYDDELYEVAKL